MFFRLLQVLPAALVGLRFCLAPFLLLDARDGKTSLLFVILCIIAFLSDIFDGIIARKVGVSTANLRKADSWADVSFYIGVAISAWMVHQDVVIAFRQPLSLVLLVQLVWWAVNLWKYGQPASYHTYSAKAWGITLFVAAIALFGFNYAGIALWSAIIVGIVHTIEEILMTLILPQWTHDVLSLIHARRLCTQ